MKFSPLCAAALFLLSACSTTPQVSPAISSAVQSHNVAPATAGKMNAGQPLDVDDIANLVKADMPSALVVGYLNSTRRVYHLSPAQLSSLRSQGASPQILNYLQESGGFYGQTGVSSPNPVPRGQQRAAYENSPLYQDQQPFAYNEPIIDDWYDSAYEESLYSPFSYDN